MYVYLYTVYPIAECISMGNDHCNVMKIPFWHHSDRFDGLPLCYTTTNYIRIKLSQRIHIHSGSKHQFGSYPINVLYMMLHVLYRCVRPFASLARSLIFSYFGIWISEWHSADNTQKCFQKISNTDPMNISNKVCQLLNCPSITLL